MAALLAAYAASPAMLIFARAFMGLAGAMMLPSTVALLSNMFQEPAQRTQAIGVWAASFSVGVALGLLVGGGLLESFWWGSVFLVNALGMAVVLVMAPLVLPEFRGSAVGRVDLPSVALSLAAVIAMVYGIKELANDGMDVRADIAIAAGLLAGIAFAALAKTAAKVTSHGQPVHSFATLLADLATIAANRIQPTGGLPAFTQITRPAPAQRRAFELLSVSHRLGYA